MENDCDFIVKFDIVGEPMTCGMARFGRCFKRGKEVRNDRFTTQIDKRLLKITREGI